MAAVIPTKNAMGAGERKKVYVLIGLLVVLALSIAYRFAGGSSTSEAPPPSPQASAPRSAPGQPAAATENQVTEPGATEPLPLEQLVYAPVGDVVARNPFAFPPPPPPPPPPPQPEPPVPTILIGNVTPNTAVAGSPRTIEVTVTGRAFPVDARVEWNGRLLPTRYVSPEQLRVSLGPNDTASAGSVRVRVVSESQPTRLWSDPRSFDIREAPRPSFQYIGRIGDVALVDYGGPGNQKTVRVGDMIGVPAIWKVVAISPEKIDLLDTRNDIPRTVPLARKDR
jgi:hypothetical protein